MTAPLLAVVWILALLIGVGPVLLAWCRPVIVPRLLSLMFGIGSVTVMIIPINGNQLGLAIISAGLLVAGMIAAAACYIGEKVDHVAREQTARLLRNE